MTEHKKILKECHVNCILSDLNGYNITCFNYGTWNVSKEAFKASGVKGFILLHVLYSMKILNHDNYDVNSYFLYRWHPRILKNEKKP